MGLSLQSPDSPAWQCGGRVLVGRSDKGAGVAVRSRLALTAGHVAKSGQADASVVFKTWEGQEVRVIPPIRFADGLDAAALELAEDVACSQVANAVPGERWFANATGASNDPVLTGAVTVIGVPIIDAMGNRVAAMQLEVDQDLGGFKGYSGSAVLNELGQVIGVLIEQKPQRLAAPRPPASNVLFALLIVDVTEKLGVDLPLAEPARTPGGITERVETPVPPAPTINVPVTVSVVSSAHDLTPPIPPPPQPPPEAAQPQPLVEPKLPAQALSPGLHRIIGRGEEIDAVTRRLKRGDRRLVTLWGPPGVGKTRLSIAIAERWAKMFPERAWNIKLEALPARANARVITQYMVETLRMPDVQSEDMLDVLARALGQRPALFILDNCEHVAAGVAEVADQLLRAVRELRVLTTSQKPLGVDGEFVVEVEPLLLDDAVRLFKNLAGEGRTIAAQAPDAVIRDISRKVDRIPLAISLAAARVREGDAVDEVRDGLSRSLRVLVGSHPDSDPRHQAMETALDWSYKLLDEDGQRTLRVTSIFTAPFDRNAVGYLLGESNTGFGSKTDTVLRTLKSRALLQAEGGRLTWLETIRQYGEKKLRQSGEATEVSERCARYFLEMAEAAAAHAHCREGLDWLARLEANRDHMRAALAILAKRPQDFELRLRLTVALENFWLRRGYLQWGSDELHEVLASSQAQGRPRALALVAAGRIAIRQGDFEHARALLDEALAIGRTLHNPSLEALALQARGFLMTDTGEHVAARPLLEQALAKARTAGLRWLEGVALGNLGRVHQVLQQLPEAERFLNQSLEIADELGDVLAKGALLHNIGLLRQDQEDYAEAREAYEEACRIHTDAREPYAVAIVRSNLARVMVLEHRYDDAEAILDEVAAEAGRIGAHGLVGWAQQQMGWLAETRALDPQLALPEEERHAALTTALRHYEAARDLHQQLGDRWRTALNAEAAGWVADYLADQGKALQYLNEAATLYRQDGREDDAQRIDSVIAEAAAIPPPDLLAPLSEGLRRLEAVLTPAGKPDRQAVREAIADAEVYTLGYPAGDTSVLVESTESDLLHFTIDSGDGTELTMLPIFTRGEIMRTALLRNPDWQSLSVLEVNGRALLDNIDDDVTVVINPWSDMEYQLPSRSVPAQTDVPGEPSFGLAEVESVVRQAVGQAGSEDRVREAVRSVDIYALGHPAGDTSVPRKGTETDLLHFTVDDENGAEAVMLPVFTNPMAMRSALIRNPEWQQLSVLQINGDALLANVDDDITVVINPWSDLEYQLPSRTSLQGSSPHPEPLQQERPPRQ